MSRYLCDKQIMGEALTSLNTLFSIGKQNNLIYWRGDRGQRTHAWKFANQFTFNSSTPLLNESAETLIRPMVIVSFAGDYKKNKLYQFLEEIGVTFDWKAASVLANEKGARCGLSVDNPDLISQLPHLCSAFIEKLQVENLSDDEKQRESSRKKSESGKKSESDEEPGDKDIELPNIDLQPDQIKIFLTFLKTEVDNEKWNTMGEGFFNLKVPGNIAKMRKALSGYHENLPQDQANKILHNIKNISAHIDLKGNRYGEVQQFYEELQKNLQTLFSDRQIKSFNKNTRI